VAENNVGQLTFAVGHAKRHDNAAIVHDTNFNTVRIGQRIQDDGPPVPRAEVFLLNSGFRRSLSQEQAADGGNENKSGQAQQSSRDHGEECTTARLICDVRKLS
jgi:hypothetical protein